MFAEVEGPTHRYMDSSPGCWACYGEVLALEYSDFRYQRVHRLTVDSHAVQHPGTPSPQSIQSVALHLMSLCAVLEGGVDMARATQIISQAAKKRERFEWLSPPSPRGEMTVADVYRASGPDEHVRRVREWAQAAWSAWSDHHAIVRAWSRGSW